MARAAGLLLVGLLLGQVQVAGFGLRGRLVRLPDVAVVALAQDPDRDVAVRRLLLLRRGESRRILIVVGRLADELLAGVPALAGVARLGLVGNLLRDVQVAGFGLRRCLVRLPDVAVVARAENPDGDVAVRRLLLLRRCESGRILIVVSRLRDDLLAGVPALAGVARLGLVSMLSGQVDVARFRLRRRVVRLPDVSAVAGAENPDGDVAVRRLLLLRRRDRRCILVRVGRLADRLQTRATRLGLVSVLLGEVRVACRRFRRRLVRL